MPAWTTALAGVLIIAFPSAGLPADDANAPQASLERGRRDLPLLALTFDGGGDAGDTARILDILDERGVRATFFLTGGYIRSNPALVRRIADAGHEVGNHTFSHPHLTTWDHNRRHLTLPGIDRAVIQGELLAASLAFEEATGRPLSRLWRAPYGEVNAELLHWAHDGGWRHIGWSRDAVGGRHTLDSLDWVSDRGSRNYLTSAQMAARILSYDGAGHGLNGGIVLLHLSSRRADPLVGRLAALIDALRARGYAPGTVGALERSLEPEGRQMYLTELR